MDRRNFAALIGAGFCSCLCSSCTPAADPKERTYQPLNRVSPVVEALAKTQFDDFVKRVRVFAEPEIAGKLSELPVFREELVRALAE